MGQRQHLLRPWPPKDARKKETGFNHGSGFPTVKEGGLDVSGLFSRPGQRAVFWETQGMCPSALQLWNFNIWTSCSLSSELFGEPL